MVKNNKIKQKRIINEDMTYIRNMFILLVIVVLVVVGLYYLTDHLVKNDNETTKSDVVIDYDIATIGTMFNRIEDEYYVLIYSKKVNGDDLDQVLNQYRSSDDYIKTYYIDLDKKINSSTLKDTTNEYPNNSNEVSVTGPTLYKISNKQVVNCYIGVDEIKSIIEIDE